MSSTNQAPSQAQGFHGIVIARPAIVIPDRFSQEGDSETRGSPEDRDFVENGDKGSVTTPGEVENDPGSVVKDLNGTEDQPVIPSPREKFTMSEGGSPLITQPRKLPIPNAGANSNTTLKGILIKPKRILPAQPSGLKPTKNGQSMESPAALTSIGLKPTRSGPSGQERETLTATPSREKVDDCIYMGLNPSRPSGVESSESPPRLSVIRLQINVDRLKSHFATQDKGGPNVNSTLGRDAKSGLCGGTDTNYSANLAQHVKLNTDCANTENDGLKPSGEEIREWCSMELNNNNGNKMTNNMSSVPSVSKSFQDRSIRSPSPKSNTTWDRSSSGYSSDERADPRSPPPTISSASTVCTKTEHLEDDGVSMLNETNVKQGTSGSENESLLPVSGICDGGTSELVLSDSNGVTCNCPIPDVCPHSLGQNTVQDKCENCDNNTSDTNSVTPENGTQTTSLQTESQIIPKTINRRPAWTPGLLNSPTSGRIQYRKSGTEPMISLRHPNRQGNVDSFDGLEVCGKSYPQTLNSKTEPASDTARNDVSSGNRPETLTPLSAFSVPDRTSGVVPENVNGAGKMDNITPEIIRPKVLRQPLSTAKNMKDLKAMTLNMNVKLNLTRDDKDIRKTLQDLNSPRRQSPGGKSLPIRARHDPTMSQSMSSSFTSIQKPANSGLGKKMWRAPSGLPEHAQMRPFSPFGGTLPPAKLKESERKKQMTE